MRSRLLTLVIVALAPAGCGRDAPPEFQPDAALREALGLDSRDWVHSIDLRVRGSAEVATPARIRIQPGHWVDFRGGDARGHVVHFDTTTLADEARRWLRTTDQVEGPPLLSPASRWVVSFDEAPAGVYPFTVEGSGQTGTGVIQVTEGGR